MSAISAIMSNFYSVMANNSAYSWMQAANSRMGLANSAASNLNNVNFRALANADTMYELQMIQNSFSYKAAKAMQEAMEKLEKESKPGFDTFA